jgi:hypothetical protein
LIPDADDWLRIGAVSEVCQAPQKAGGGETKKADLGTGIAYLEVDIVLLYLLAGLG